MNLACIITDIAQIRDQDTYPILAVAVLLMWLKLCYFGRIFLSTAWMVRMLYAVTYDMGYFLLIFMIMVLGFTNTFFILARNGSPAFAGDNFWQGIIYSYRTGIGDFNTDNYLTNRDEILVWIVWLLSTFLILIVFLNMIIAIISDIFEKVHENIQNNLLKELVILMVETELLLSRKTLFKNKKYLIIIEKEKGETTKVEAESKLAIMKLNMLKKVNEQKLIIESLNKEFELHVETELETRVLELETAINKELGKLSEKVEIFEHTIGDLKATLDRGKL